MSGKGNKDKCPLAVPIQAAEPEAEEQMRQTTLEVLGQRRRHSTMTLEELGQRRRQSTLKQHGWRRPCFPCHWPDFSCQRSPCLSKPPSCEHQALHQDFPACAHRWTWPVDARTHMRQVARPRCAHAGNFHPTGIFPSSETGDRPRCKE